MKNITSIFSKQKTKTAEGVLSPHVDALHRQAYYYTGNQHDAEDLLQDLFVYVCQRKEKLLVINPVKPWLMTCLYHRFIDNLRKKTARVDEFSMDDDFDIVDPVAPEDSDMGEQIKKCLKHLSPEQRAAISLFYIEGFTLVEVAAAMMLPEGTVKSHLHRGRKKLAAMLDFNKNEEAEKTIENMRVKL